MILTAVLFLAVVAVATATVLYAVGPTWLRHRLVGGRPLRHRCPPEESWEGQFTAGCLSCGRTWRLPA